MCGTQGADVAAYGLQVRAGEGEGGEVVGPQEDSQVPNPAHQGRSPSTKVIWVTQQLQENKAVLSAAVWGSVINPKATGKDVYVMDARYLSAAKDEEMMNE
jgi:hypothetical protein